MIKLSKKADYAVLVMASLAHRQLKHRDEQTSDGAAALPVPPASAHDIADESGVSRALVANILKALTRADLLESVRGASGGYRITKPLDDINLAQIITALEGPIRIVDCASLSEHRSPNVAAHDCSLSDHCPSRSAMHVVQNRIARLMEDIHLPELLQFDYRSAPTLRP
jgi:Rrf2 family protein